MKPTTEFKIVDAIREDYACEISQLLSEGWELLGYLNIYHSGSNTYFVRELIRINFPQPGFKLEKALDYSKANKK